MTNNEYIIRAVELADGWNGDLFMHEYALEPPEKQQRTLDALAAQLVRQADVALDDWRCLELFAGHTSVRAFEDLDPCGHDLAACYGKGRTMNTIRAIVSSRVLEEHEQ